MFSSDFPAIPWKLIGGQTKAVRAGKGQVTNMRSSPQSPGSLGNIRAGHVLASGQSWNVPPALTVSCRGSQPGRRCSPELGDPWG